MSIIERGFEQRSESWFKARLGNPGASEIDNIITSEGKPSKSRTDFLYTLAAQRIRGKADESFQSQSMIDGQTKEDEARSLFSLIHNVEIEQVGMIYKDERRLCHASPDGLISEDGGIEIKCPLGKTHTRYLLENKLPTSYYVQIQSSLYISERKYWWFMSYCDGMKPLLIRVEPDKVYQKALAVELELFCDELDNVVKKIRG
jgi:putative phage-type endonuclease